MVQNCPECDKAGASTECQYMEFPVSIHHYFESKVCTFHYWLLFVKPKKSWEEYLKFAKADSASAGYVLTFPPDSLVKTVLSGGLPTTVETPIHRRSASASDSEPPAQKETSAGASSQQPSTA